MKVDNPKTLGRETAILSDLHATKPKGHAFLAFYSEGEGGEVYCSASGQHDHLVETIVRGMIAEESCAALIIHALFANKEHREQQKAAEESE